MGGASLSSSGTGQTRRSPRRRQSTQPPSGTPNQMLTESRTQNTSSSSAYAPIWAASQLPTPETSVVTTVPATAPITTRQDASGRAQPLSTSKSLTTSSKMTSSLLAKKFVKSILLSGSCDWKRLLHGLELYQSSLKANECLICF